MRSLKVLLLLLAVCWLAKPLDPLWTLLLANCAYVAYLLAGRDSLPPRLASQFDFKLQAQGWISRRVYLILLSSIGVGVSLVMVSASEAIKFQSEFMSRHMLWVACLLIGFLASVHALTVRANRETPPRLSKLFWAALAVFQILIGLWVTAIYTHDQFGWPQ